MLFFTFCFLILPFFLPEVSASDDIFTGLRFGDDGYSLISFQPDMSALAEKFSFCVWINQRNSGNPTVFTYDATELVSWGYGHIILFENYDAFSSRMTLGQWNQYCGSWSLASRTFRAYFNGTLAGTLTTDSGRKLRTGGTLVLGDIWDTVVGGQRTNYHFAGEMYNLNMFAKELSGPEIAELSENGICTTIPEKLQPYRVIKWEEVMELPRQGNVIDIRASCRVSVNKQHSNLQLNSVIFTV